MSGAHVDRLLSDACDGALTAEQRVRFDRHLSACPRCSAAFAAMAAALDALHELGPAPMPRPVLLPEGRPAPAGGRLARWAGGLRRHRWVTSLAATGVAAAVAAAVVVAGRLPGPVAHPAVAPPSSSPALAAPGSGCLGCQGVALPLLQCVVQPLPSPGPSPEKAPPGFTNAASEDDGSRRVVLATQASASAPGDTLDIYARVIDDATGAVGLPCVYLTGVTGAHPAQAALPQAATPAGRVTIDGVPVLEVTIPRAATRGETLELLAEVPAADGQPARQVTLPIQVT
jgi:hypothetical protein